MIDKIHTAQPTYGRIRITDEINVYLAGHNIKRVNEKRIRRLMKIMEIETIYQKPNLSKLGQAKYIYPYLLRKLEITRPNQVWASDISYIPFNGGFMYLYAIIDVYSRAIVGWSLSSSLEQDFVIDTIKEAFEKYGKPEIMNSDQGSHFTSKEYIELLSKKEIKISMDGKARALDNIYIERFWRTIKYEYLFLNEFLSPNELEKGIYNFMHLYNYYRHHQGINKNYPMKVYDEKKYQKEIEDNNTFDSQFPQYILQDEMNKMLSQMSREQLEKYRHQLSEYKCLLNSEENYNLPKDLDNCVRKLKKKSGFYKE